MNKNIIKNPWILALMILVTGLIIGIALTPLRKLGGGASISVATVFLSVYLVGILYAHLFKKDISKKTKLHTVIIYTLINIIVAVAYSSSLEEMPPIETMILISVIMGALMGLFVYWVLGFSTRTYLKKK